jgi:hypothetical protein
MLSYRWVPILLNHHLFKASILYLSLLLGFDLLRCSVSRLILLQKVSPDEPCGDPRPGTLLCLVMGHPHATILLSSNGFG